LAGAGLWLYALTQSADEQVRLRACQWWTSRRMGWKETSVNEQVGKDGGPMWLMRGYLRAAV
jgi:hypothetical protein